MQGGLRAKLHQDISAAVSTKQLLLCPGPAELPEKHLGTVPADQAPSLSFALDFLLDCIGIVVFPEAFVSLSHPVLRAQLCQGNAPARSAQGEGMNSSCLGVFAALAGTERLFPCSSVTSLCSRWRGNSLRGNSEQRMEPM